MEGKVVVITGAKGGLGSFVTQRFLDAGARVIGISRSIKETDFPHANFTPLPGELSSGDTTRKVVDAAAQRFGRIDVLVHLVGGFAGGRSVIETDDATFEQMADLNLRSAFYLFRATLPYMRNAGAGRIIAIGSRAAQEPQPGLSAYSAFKAALLSLVRTVAVENKDLGITANIVLPGAMDTPANRAADPQGDFSKLIDPSKVADVIHFLASDAASQISGAAVPVYGRDV